VTSKPGPTRARGSVQPGMDDIERETIRAEGLDPNNPAVVEALEQARRELALHTMR